MFKIPHPPTLANKFKISECLELGTNFIKQIGLDRSSLVQMLLWTLICPKLAYASCSFTSLLLYAMRCVENLKLNVKVFV